MIKYCAFFLACSLLACAPQQEKKPQNSPTKTAKKENLPAKTENEDTLMARIEGDWAAGFAQTEDGDPLPCEGHYLRIKKGYVTFYRADGKSTAHQFYWDTTRHYYLSKTASKMISYQDKEYILIYEHEKFHGLSMGYSRIKR